MPVIFRKPDGSEVPVELCDRNLNLLAHAQIAELEIGSQCGGHGVCGGDRVRIEDACVKSDLAERLATPHGLSSVTEEEKRHLSAEELRDGWRLACQCYPEQSDLTVRVRLRYSNLACPE